MHENHHKFMKFIDINQNDIAFSIKHPYHTKLKQKPQMVKI